jgi:PAS domain S-box-containing protein
MNVRAILTTESLQEAVRAHKKRIGDSAEPIRTELEMVRKDGRRIWTENVTTLLADRSDGQRRYLASTRDITQRRHLEDERISTEQKFRLLVEQAADLIFTLDLNGYYTYVSPSYERTLGYAPRDIVGHHYRENLSESDAERMDEMFETARDQPGRLVELELDVRTVSGELITVHSRGGALLNRDGVVIGIAGVARDVTAERNLFREVHHRVKNNLQILNSMISLKAMELGTPALLHDLQSRVNVIGRLHETLQDRGRIDAVDLAVYLGGILDHYEELGGGHQPIEVSVESIVVTSDRAMRIGIVVNELVSNAMEHREQTSGAISVLLSREDSRMRLSVANGWHGARVVEGRDGGAGAARRQSLGTELVGELVTQLGGTWWIEGGDDRIEAVVTLPVEAV